jgi:phosphoribosylanthranilate isomerase
MSENTDIKIKMCGFTRAEDARAAVGLGVDAIGMLFYPGSPRFVSQEQAREIAAEVHGKALLVGLFVDAQAAFIEDILDDVPLDILQFHGSESLAFCQSFGKPFWKTLRVKQAEDLPVKAAEFADADGILVDTWHPTKAGGTGETFDWTLLEGLEIHRHLVLAGGLNPDNVRQAIKQVRPWAVDVASGVEERPGIKSYALMQDFVKAVGRKKASGLPR